MYRFLLLLSLVFFSGCTDNTTFNTAPIADAGNYQYLEAGSIVRLNGSKSHDEDGDELTFKWTMVEKPAGSSASLRLANTVSPYFTSDLEGNYVIQLIVNDGVTDSLPDYVTINTITFVDPDTTSPQMDNLIYTPTNIIEKRPMLVIRLAFSNQTFVSGESTWQSILFGKQAHQLNNYYQEVSHQQFEFEPVADAGDTTDGITTITFTNTEHPDPDINANGFTAKLHPFLKDAIIQVSDAGFDFSAYDSDNDGAITPEELIVTFIMAGEEDAYSGGSSANGVWAHQWCTESSYTPTVNGVSVMSCEDDGNYAIFGERHRDSASSSHDATVGIIAHELGHSTFSLPDLYDTNSQYGGISYYGLMSNGSWGMVGTAGQPGDTPTHFCAWSKIDIGWYSATATPNDITTDHLINATGTADYNIIKTPVSGVSNEYFLIENRGTSGYDAGLKYLSTDFQGGLAVWHIDSNTISANLNDNSVNDNASHKGVDLEEADTPSLDNSEGDPTKNLFYSGNKTEFTPNTFPGSNLYNNARTFIFMTDVSSPSDVMTLRINNPQL